MKHHPAASLLPPMTDDEYASLKVSIAGQGLLDPIVIHLGTVLDGRHRLRACQELGVEPRFVDFAGGDPVAYVLASNVERRHLTPSQRAAVAVEAEAMFTAAAEKRKGGRPRKDEKPPADLPEVSGQALAQAAKAAGASRRTAQSAKAVKAADPGLFEKVKNGEVKVDAAVKQVQARNVAEATQAMERIVRGQVPGAAEDIDRCRVKALYSRHLCGVTGLLTMDTEAVAAALDDMDARLLVGLATDLGLWAKRVAGGGLRLMKEN